MKKILLTILPLLLIVGCSEPITDITDIDGNTYKTVKIGRQIWMAENLKVTRYRNGDPIPNIDFQPVKETVQEAYVGPDYFDKSGYRKALMNNPLNISQYELKSMYTQSSSTPSYRTVVRFKSRPDTIDWFQTEQGAYCNYNNNENNVETYGGLYNWYTVNDKRGLAPEGWHIPTDEEWNKLVDYLGGDKKGRPAGDKLRSTGTYEPPVPVHRCTWPGGHRTLYRDMSSKEIEEMNKDKIAEYVDTSGLWKKDDALVATDESGFTALPAGCREYDDCNYYAMGTIAYFWSSTEHGSGSAWNRDLYYSSRGVYRGTRDKNYGLSVRCIKD
jgi:hypothetical protein